MEKLHAFTFKLFISVFIFAISIVVIDVLI